MNYCIYLNSSPSPQLPPVFIPAPTIDTSFAGPLSVIGAFLILAALAMMAAYFANANNLQQRSLSTQRSYTSQGGYNYDYRDNILPQLQLAQEKYYS